MFDSMIDDALCIDADAEFASMDPAYGDGSTIVAAMDEPTIGSAEYDALHLNVSAYS
jgi:hypothetical protein